MAHHVQKAQTSNLAAQVSGESACSSLWSEALLRPYTKLQIWKQGKKPYKLNHKPNTTNPKAPSLWKQKSGHHEKLEPKPNSYPKARTKRPKGT